VSISLETRSFLEICSTVGSAPLLRGFSLKNAWVRRLLGA
jgi:hypothetical protein